MSIVLFAMMAPLIIGAVGLSVDGGRLAVERANVRSAADSAARAIGQDCARATRAGASSAVLVRCTSSGSANTVQLAVNGNSAGASGSVGGSLSPASGTATVTVTKTVPMTLGATIGIQPKEVSSSATVTWNQTPLSGWTLPLTLDICEYNAWKLNPSTAHKLYRYDPDIRSNQEDPSNCAKPGGGFDNSIGGALWVVEKKGSAFDEARCLTNTLVGFQAEKTFPKKPDFPPSCVDRANSFVLGNTYLMPVTQSDGWNGWGNGVAPTVRGYAAFVITGYRLGGNNAQATKIDTSAPSCTGGCLGLQGYFSGSVTELEGADSYGVDPNADFGSIRVKITS